MAFFGCMLFMFVVAVKMDVSMVVRTGKKTWFIGVLTFVVPLCGTTVFARFLKARIRLERKVEKSVIPIAFFLSCSSFHVIACIVSDLKLLNSELGRLAVSSSMISGIISWIWETTLVSARQSDMSHEEWWWASWMTMGSLVVMVGLILLVLRPIMVWMIRQTPTGKPIREGYVCCVFLMLLGCALFGECVGQHFLIGPIVLGLAVPDGPPLGSALVEKVESFVSAIMLPLYFVFSGARFRFSFIEPARLLVVELLALSSFLGKIMGAMLPSLFCNMPLLDSFSLGLIMTSQGITDIIFIHTAKLLYVSILYIFFIHFKLIICLIN